jgi:hypothetical protein
MLHTPKYADLGHNVMNVIVGVATPVSIRENGKKWAEVVKGEKKIPPSSAANSRPYQARKERKG